MSEPIKVTVATIRIALSNNSILERSEDFMWEIKGKIYPRHMKLMNQLNDLLRESDQ